MAFSPGINFSFFHFLLVVVIVDLDRNFYKLVKSF
jgi:hypothetical protein